MKRIIGIIAIVLVVIMGSSAVAEVFEVRNGIRFGMTEKEVREVERNQNKVGAFTNFNDYIWANTSIAGVEKSRLFYYFDYEGKLNEIQYGFGDKNGSRDINYTISIYNDIQKSLMEKYGAALHEDDGYTFGITSKAIEETPGITNYTEWLVEFDDCYAVIDLVMNYGSFSGTYHCRVGYKSIPFSKMEKYMEDAQEKAEQKETEKANDL